MDFLNSMVDFGSDIIDDIGEGAGTLVAGLLGEDLRDGVHAATSGMPVSRAGQAQIDQEIDETNIWRITRAAEAQQKALFPDLDDRNIYHRASNGVRISRFEKDGFEKVLSEIMFSKKKK